MHYCIYLILVMRTLKVYSQQLAEYNSLLLMIVTISFSGLLNFTFCISGFLLSNILLCKQIQSPTERQELCVGREQVGS